MSVNLSDMIGAALVLLCVLMLAGLLLALAQTDNHLCKSPDTIGHRSASYCASLSYWLD